MPGHRAILHDSSERIAELKHHHEIRLAEIMNILKKVPMTAYQVAGNMHWDVKCNSWEEFPVYQKWFATGEAIAHVEHLATLMEIKKTQSGAKVVYECA